MEKEEFVLVSIFCQYHNVKESFIEKLYDYSLIEIVQQNNASYLMGSDLNKIEKMIRLHDELNINTEGLDAILHLLQKMENMRAEMQQLKSRLRLYE